MTTRGARSQSAPSLTSHSSIATPRRAAVRCSWPPSPSSLLIACANVASLLLAQTNERRKEIALRLALGVQRWRLIRQLLTESLIIAVAGGVLGVLLAAGLRGPVAAALANSQGLSLELALNPNVLLFTVGLCLLTGLLFGLVPALQSSRPQLVGALKDSNDSSLSPGRKITARRVLVVTQMALAVVSLVAAALFVRSLGAALDLELGYSTEELIALGFNVGLQGYSPEEGEQFFRRAETGRGLGPRHRPGGSGLRRLHCRGRFSAP